MKPQQLEIVADDAACRPCGYNLRGLSPWGKCPECGGDIQDTLREIRDGAIKMRRLNDVDPKTLNQWIEGLCCVTAWFIIDALADFEWVRSRPLQLATYVTGWAIGYLGIWKIAKGGIMFRACLIFGGLFPFAWGLESLPEQHWPRAEVLLFLPGIFATAVFLQFRLARIAQLIPSLSLTIQFYAFTATALFGTLLLSIPIVDFDSPQSLEMMQLLPSPAFTTTLWIYYFHRPLVNTEEYLLCGISALLAWPPAMTMILLVRLLRARARIQRIAEQTDLKAEGVRRDTDA